MNEFQMSSTNTKGVYRHAKSAKMYEVIGMALHAENEQNLVVYRPQGES